MSCRIADRVCKLATTHVSMRFFKEKIRNHLLSI